MSTLRADFRGLVYKLCEQRDVPVLVTDLIAEHLDQKDLLRINILSRHFNAQANAAIYRNIVVNLDGSKRSVQKAALLFRTLLTSRTAASAVQSLSLAGNPLLSWRTKSSPLSNAEIDIRGKIPPDIHADLNDFTQGETELYAKNAARSSASIRRPLPVVLGRSVPPL